MSVETRTMMGRPSDTTGPASTMPAPAGGLTEHTPAAASTWTAPGTRRTWRRLVSKQTVQPIIGLIVLVLAWQVAIKALHVSLFIMPAPTDVWHELLQHPDLLWSNTIVTFEESVLGLALALVIGVALAVLIAYSGTARRVIYPYLVILQVTPIVATAPLLSIWFGFGLKSKVIITFLIAFFPITVGMATGLRSASSDSRMLMRSLASSRWDEFRRMRLPYALVHLVSGLRVAAPATVIGAIIAEFVSSQKGLGYLIIQSQSALNTPLLFLAIFGASIMGLIFFQIVNLIERRWLGWHETTRDEL